jgi:hypothetical protein
MAGGKAFSRIYPPNFLGAYGFDELIVANAPEASIAQAIYPILQSSSELTTQG